MGSERNEGEVGDRVGGDEAELDNIPDLSIDDESQDPVLLDSDKTSKPTGPTVSHGDETEEVLKIPLDVSPLYGGFQVSKYRFQWYDPDPF